MGIVSICNVCSHLQNASRARLGFTSIPNNKYNLAFAVALHRAGLINGIVRGGPYPPPMSSMGAVSRPEAGHVFDVEPVTHANVASRRLWLGLKYWKDEPVLRSLTPLSKPSRLVTVSADQLKLTVVGKDSRWRRIGVKGLSMGELMFLSTDRGILEAREAIEKEVGGLLLAKAS